MSHQDQEESLKPASSSVSSSENLTCETAAPRLPRLPPELMAKKKLVIRGRYAKGELTYIRQEFFRLGFIEIHRDSPYYDACWAIRFLPPDFQAMKPNQKVNCMPGTGVLCRKDRLHALISGAQRYYGLEPFRFWPVGFRLPAEWPQFEAYWREQEAADTVDHQQQEGQHLRDQAATGVNAVSNAVLPDEEAAAEESKSQTHGGRRKFREPWILKPPLSSCGRRIRLITSIDEVNPADEWMEKNIPLAQRYIMDPLLVDGFKCTLRIYVALTEVNPLRVYVFSEGLVRICSSRYDVSVDSFADQFRHIDSIDINEVRTDAFCAEVDPSVPNREGLRMLVTDWARWLSETRGLDVEQFWNDVHDVVIKSILAAEPVITKEVRANVKRRDNCFDLFGYDILVDQQHRCWLLEINRTPSISPHTELENQVKITMLRSLIALVDYQGNDAGRVTALVEVRWPNLVALQQRQREAAELGVVAPHFSLLQSLTREMLWVIVDTELERERCEHWVPVFPSQDPERYQPYMMKNKNVTIHDWLQAGLHSSMFDDPPLVPAN